MGYRAGDEDVIAAFVVERLAGEAAVQRFQLEAGDVEQPEPFVPRRPPERARRTAVEREIDAVFADRVPDRVRHRSAAVRAVETHRDLVVERQGIPREAPARTERRGDALERATTVSPGREVQQRVERAVDQRRGLVESEVAHVSLA